jgi:DNA-binding transcriptional regulator YiaG
MVNALDYRKDGYRRIMAETGLKQIRQELGISQEGVARRTRSISTGTVKNAESGKRVTFDTATQILQAVNNLLAEAGRESITLDDLGLTLY